MYDYLIVGAGYAGSVLAERLARDAGQKILLIDRRPHIAGNAYDYTDNAGIRVHSYGPHIFHTNSREVSDYLSRFTEWRPYEHRVLAHVEGKLLPIPINLDTVNRLYGWNLSSEELAEYFARVAEKIPTVRNSEEVVVSRVGRDLYEKFFRGYTRKHWGIEPSQLSPQVAARIPARTDRDDRYFTDGFQFMPKEGYTHLFENMLDHENIELQLGVDFRDVGKTVECREIIYTGPVDEFFDYRFGKLPYRSIEFRFETHDRATFQPTGQVNYPNEHEYTRITEFKYLTGQQHSKTTVAYDYPRAEGDPYYPIPRPENAELNAKYQELAKATPGLHFVGRLATYRYYNMDQVVAQALALYARLRNTLPAGAARS